MMTLGEVVKAYRKSHHYSMEAFANKAGLSKGYISMLEKNKNPQNGLPITPSIETFRAIAAAMGIDVNELVKSVDANQPVNVSIFPYVQGRRLPIVGSIPAGSPILAVENIEGYDYADVPESEDYFFLRIKGDSMTGAGIMDGDLVLVRTQPYAENRDIVVCIVNGDEATLKRYYRKGDVVVLQPENNAYHPMIIPCKEFDSGYARILGVAIEARKRL